MIDTEAIRRSLTLTAYTLCGFVVGVGVVVLARRLGLRV